MGTVTHTMRTYLGTPFRPGGRGIDGIDCVGLVLRAIRALGVRAPHIGNYKIPASEGVVSARLDRSCVPVRSGDEQEGDIVLLARHGIANHLGVWTPDGIYHACACDRKVVLIRRGDRSPDAVRSIHRVKGRKVAQWDR